ncbi:SDR family NAD(P)-dependent oxidoreductase [Nocardioides sp. YIM 152315]|uniref:SDR family NAD(P)-dependent oxidoreductase n=1 Tax=Nocardioides sp. YIM 152315 TaxID=3031760 RepID=UPI0023DA2B04|nr:SDR family NAD(P)-dependent oxidoreductase [Nocardioides sp. YIM 152315]MDF1604728.1 SDR family NAD(P)-dependent oxidoreductase [Nocardioides sp. YIM 152315]
MTTSTIPPTSTLRGRRALVTGSSRGIGAALAERLAAEGADVVITGRTRRDHDSRLEGSLESVASRLAAYGGRVGLVVADLTDEESRAGVVPEAERQLGGPLDILVNNAAAAIYQPLADFPLRRRRLVFEANVHAPLDLAQAVLPGMVGRGEGWIVNVSSATAKLRPGPPFRLVPPGTAMAVYGSSKAALNRLTNALGAELHGTGVRVNTVEPRFGVLTEGADALVGDKIDTSVMESMEEMVEGTLALCRCPADVTGEVTVSLDLIERWALDVRGLDGRQRA